MGPEKRFPLPRAKFYAAEMLLALEDIHRAGYIYRDLKPENVLLDEFGHLRISDLGLAKLYDPAKPIRSFSGTPGYMAPEVMRKQDQDWNIDFWSWAVTFYEMLTGGPPRVPGLPRPRRARSRGLSLAAKEEPEVDDPQWTPFDPHQSAADNAQRGGPIRLDVEYPPILPPQAVDLFSKIFRDSPRERLGADGINSIKAHPFFSDIDWEQLRAKKIPPPFIPEKHAVNAVGSTTIDPFYGKWQDLTLTADDAVYYQGFDYVDLRDCEEEVCYALIRAENWVPPPPEKVSGCCMIL
eukprot:TRINITY_DN1211_c0_g1_i3.p1 TRINITY_DN1211_c0_g1~~TRINITY_DN1211_c0_g1_i3.p1  ORF type:complete len:305 (-),score=75.32 TRINITY_DN1211_c0_g1_i3:136-1020(-)